MPTGAAASHGPISRIPSCRRSSRPGTCETRRRRSPRRGGVADPDHGPHTRPRRRVDPDLVVTTTAHERAGERRIHAHIAAHRIDLVRPDDAQLALGPLVVDELHPGAEENAVRIVLRSVDHHDAVQPLAQEPHAPVDLPQLLLAVDVFGVLRPVALRGGFRDRPGDLWPLHAPQVVELRAEPPGAFWRYVFRAGRLRFAVSRHVLKEPASARRGVWNGSRNPVTRIGNFWPHEHQVLRALSGRRARSAWAAGVPRHRRAGWHPAARPRAEGGGDDHRPQLRPPDTRREGAAMGASALSLTVP